MDEAGEAFAGGRGGGVEIGAVLEDEFEVGVGGNGAVVDGEGFEEVLGVGGFGDVAGEAGGGGGGGVDIDGVIGLGDGDAGGCWRVIDGGEGAGAGGGWGGAGGEGGPFDGAVGPVGEGPGLEGEGFAVGGGEGEGL